MFMHTLTLFTAFLELDAQKIHSRKVFSPDLSVLLFVFTVILSPNIDNLIVRTSLSFYDQ